MKKKHNCCLTCSIICFVLIVIFFVALYVGGTILFKQYVSPQIGGLELNDAIALAGNVFAGKEAKTDYSEADLDSFYSGLSDAMFLSDKNEDELEYELVPAETRATLAPSASIAAAAEEGSEEEYDEDAAYAAFRLKLPADRYALLPEATRALITLDEFSALAAETDAAVAARKKVGLKKYRLSIDALMKDMDFGAEDFDAGKAMEKTLSSLEFNFDTLESYDINNAAAEQNAKFTTFSVNGKQASAFINDIITYLLTAENSPLTSTLNKSVVKDVPLNDYIKVASVTIMNTPLSTSNGEAIYDQKDTALGITISINLRDLVKAAMQTSELKERLESVPDFARNLIPSLVPKFFSANVTVYPLAPEEDGREIIVTVNKASAKNAERLSILTNALLGDGEDSSRTFFGTINDKVASVFSSINETVKINFVPSKDAEGKTLKDEKGNAYSELRIMTWQTVLSLIDKEGRLSDHDVLTMLKCLYISKDEHLEIDTDTAFSSFTTDMSDKYGVEKAYLDEHNILSTEDLSGMTEHIDLSSIELKTDNEAMRVRLSAEALAAFMTKYVSKEDSSTAAAEEGSSSSIFEGLDLKITDVTIDKVSETGGVAIYSFELGLLFNIEEMLGDKLPTDGIGGTLSKKILPKGDSYFCIKLYMSEYVDAESGKLVHKVGKNIDNPAEGKTSAYLSDIRINDFTYAETARVFDALNTFMEVLSDTSFKISEITGTIEDAVNDVFDSIAKNDFNLELRLYAKDDATRGGLTLPSLYELLKSVVEPKLDAEKGETFTVIDARNVIAQIYQNQDVDTTVYFEEDQADSFLGEINDKYYIKWDSALKVSDLFGDGASDLSTKIKADSIYFKYDADEAAKWTGEKKSLYGDDRSVSDLRIHLTGTEIAALVKGSNMIPDDLASSFGTIEVLGARFSTVEGKTYLTFDMKLVKKEADGDLKFGKAFPADVKLSAKILLYAPSYSEAEPRYSSHIIINDAASEKAFLLLRALGGDSLSEKSISDKISESLATTFNTLEGKIPLFYSDGGTAYTLGSEQCILVSDVYSFLVKETSMTDLNGEPTDPENLRKRMHGFGEQDAEDRENAGDYTWLDGLNLFAYTDDDNDANDDDAYVYKNMQEAYFLKSEMTLDDIYGDGTFSNKFNEIKTTSFNLTGEGGLFTYGGDIKSLKISDKALGVIVKKKQNFTAAVSGEGVIPEIMSLKLYHEAGNLVIESGIKISFDGRATYATLPDYFFVIAKTTRSWDDDLGKYVFTTTLAMNNLSSGITDELFCNITSLESKGVNTSTFNKDNILNTINTQISNAFNNLPSSIDFGEFTATDIANEYHTGATYPEGCPLPVEGAGYLSFPSVYSYMIDIFYTASEKATHNVQESEMQSMLLSLHNDTVEDVIVTNPKSGTAYKETMSYFGNSLYYYSMIYSDKYLAYDISSRLSSEKINGDISLDDSILQAIILKNDLPVATWGEWNNKFYPTPSEEPNYNTTHDYLIVTVKVSLSGYLSGAADLLPSDLYLTVLIDLNDASASKGLLYDMSQKNMEIFSFIMHKYNNQFDSVDDMASQLATHINNKLDEIKNINVPGLGDRTLLLNYRYNSDSFVYTTTLPYDTGTKYNVNTEIGTDGVGYVILSVSAIS